jgi:hypothetical protein
MNSPHRRRFTRREPVGNLRPVEVSSESVQRLLGEVAEDDLRVKMLLSLSDSVLHAASLCIRVIGRARGQATDHERSHGSNKWTVLLSNAKVSPWLLARGWIAMLMGIPRPRRYAHPENPRRDLLPTASYEESSLLATLDSQ